VRHGDHAGPQRRVRGGHADDGAVPRSDLDTLARRDAETGKVVRVQVGGVAGGLASVRRAVQCGVLHVQEATGDEPEGPAREPRVMRSSTSSVDILRPSWCSGVRLMRSSSPICSATAAMNSHSSTTSAPSGGATAGGAYSAWESTYPKPVTAWLPR
jgi:hypothetical protein